jgi:hypothetical protein
MKTKKRLVSQAKETKKYKKNYIRVVDTRESTESIWLY